MNLAERVAKGGFNNRHRLWDRLEEDQRREIVEAVTAYWDLPPMKRPTIQRMQQLLHEFLGFRVSRATVHKWIHENGKACQTD